MNAKNFMTPQGYRKLVEEFDQLRKVERPQVVDVVHWAAGNGDRSENGDYIYGKKRLREIDKRLGYLSKQIESAEIVDPATVKTTKIEFGATVTIEDENGDTKIYSLVGSEECDPSRGKISWRSPLAQALMRGKVGEFVAFESPQGEREVEIKSVVYKGIEA